MVQKLKWYAHKILPLAYDESLSYYEVLCKVTAKLNEVIEYIGDSLAERIREIMSESFVDAVYDSTTETITISLEETE